MVYGCEELTLNVTRLDDVGPFTDTTLPSWVSMCRLYADDVNCRPNSEILKITRDLEKAFDNPPLGPDFWSLLPTIDDTLATPDNYREKVQICEYDEVEFKCDMINQEEYVMWGTDTEHSLCTEIGYVHGVPCKCADTELKCIPSSCEDLQLYYESYVTSDKFCQMFTHCVQDQFNDSKCAKFDDYEDGHGYYRSFLWRDIINTPLSLGDIQEKCNTRDQVVNFGQYSMSLNNWQDASANDHFKIDLCIDKHHEAEGDDWLNNYSPNHCKILGALHYGSVFEYNAELKSCDRPSDYKPCNEEYFVFPIANDFYYESKEVHAPVNPVYYGGLDFGSHLCKQIQCDTGMRYPDSTSSIVNCSMCSDLTFRQCNAQFRDCEWLPESQTCSKRH